MPLQITAKTIDGNLKQRARAISGQTVQQCFQCGTCTGSCPMIEHMNITPRNFMVLLQWGQAEALQKANTPWICASCHVCQVRCPRGIELPRVMEALRQLKLRANVNHVEPSNLQPEEIIDLPAIAMVSGFRKMTS
ncbi:MAG: 4Fe-4S dicluster domain-containing protein [Candidatus Zixiibacteriota bacterium]|nr:MAG: 4Fe-4S dicluster domain-containing protein [candidate division Zixibacteria bacterium]